MKVVYMHVSVDACNAALRRLAIDVRVRVANYRVTCRFRHRWLDGVGGRAQQRENPAAWLVMAVFTGSIHRVQTYAWHIVGITCLRHRRRIGYRRKYDTVQPSHLLSCDHSAHLRTDRKWSLSSGRRLVRGLEKLKNHRRSAMCCSCCKLNAGTLLRLSARRCRKSHCFLTARSKEVTNMS